MQKSKSVRSLFSKNLMVLCIAWLFVGDGLGNWYTIEQVLKDKTMMVAQLGKISHWAGEVTHVYGTEKHGITHLKIKITWRTDEARVSCGEIIEMEYHKVQDFTQRSLKLIKC